TPVLFQRIQPRAQTRLISSGGILVQYAFLNCLVERGNGFAEDLLRGRFVALGESLAQITKGGAQARSVAAVSCSAGFSLTRALQRRKMVCHCRCLFSRMSQRDIPVGIE